MPLPIPRPQVLEPRSTMVDCYGPPPDPNGFAIVFALSLVAGVMIGLVIR